MSMAAVSGSIYQHFRPEEAELIDNLNDLINQAETEYRPILTHFLNPRELYIVHTLINMHEGVNMKSWGGFSGAERKRVLFFPDYYFPEQTDFHLSLLEVVYPHKFAVLHHGSILGTLVNSGIQREVLGDIITDSVRWQFFVEAPIAPFLVEQIDRISHFKVHLEERQLSETIHQISEWENIEDTVASLRADALISHFFKVSRKHAKDLFHAHKVQLNWMRLDKPDYELSDYDILSIRGYGRIKFKQQSGLSKKGKLKISAAVLKK